MFVRVLGPFGRGHSNPEYDKSSFLISNYITLKYKDFKLIYFNNYFNYL